MTEGSINNFLKKKKKAKEMLAKAFHFPAKKPLLAVFLDRNLKKNEQEDLCEVLKGIADVNLEVVILSDKKADCFLMPHVKHLPYTRANRRILLEGADLSLTLPFNDFEEMVLNGAIPISCERPEARDYDPNHETGNSFIYKSQSPWSIFAAVVRAIETFKFPYDWQHLVREGLDSVNR